MKKATYFVVLGVLCGCSGMSYEKPLSREDKRTAAMGKLFQKDIVLVSGSKPAPSASPVPQAPSQHISFSSVVNTLAFMGLHKIDWDKEYVETDWYTEASLPHTRVKMIVTNLKPGQAVNLSDGGNLHCVVLTQERHQGTWRLSATSAETREKWVNNLRDNDGKRSL